MGRVLVVRHRQSTWNGERRWAGQADPPLSDQGEREAAAMSDVVAGLGFAAVVTSDLRRARRTALLAAAGIPLVEDVRLRELDTPTWSGLTREQIEVLHPGVLEQWSAATVLDLPGGESWQTFEDRVLSGLIHAATHGPRVLVVAHAGVLRVIELALGSPHGRLGRSKGVWCDVADGRLSVGPVERLVTS